MAQGNQGSVQANIAITHHSQSRARLRVNAITSEVTSWPHITITTTTGDLTFTATISAADALDLANHLVSAAATMPAELSRDTDYATRPATFHSLNGHPLEVSA